MKYGCCNDCDATKLGEIRFSLRLHIMQFCLSVCPSVYMYLSARCVYCDKTKQLSVNISTPYETGISLVFPLQRRLLGPLPPEIFAESHLAPFEKPRLRQISAYNVSTLRDSEKVQLWRIKTRSRAFRKTIDRMHTLSLSPLKGGWKSDFFVFSIKVNFNRINSTTKFLCVKTSSSKGVVWPFSYLTVHRFGAKSNHSA